VTPRLALAWIGILTLYFAIRIPLLDVPLERDEGAFAVVGAAILRGEVPYRDVFDHKPPGVYYLYAAALPFVSHTARGVHAFLLVWNLLALGCVAALAARLAGAAAGCWAGLVFAVISSARAVQGFSATTEMLLLPPLAASVLLTAIALEHPGRRRLPRLAAAGALGAAACWIKQPAVAPLLIAPLLLAVRAGGLRRAARDLAVWLAAGVALSLAIVLGLAGAGAWQELRYWVVTHNQLYASQTSVDWTMRLGLALPALAWEMSVPVAAALLGGLLGAWRGERNVWVGLAFLVLSAAAVFHSPYFYAHYFALAVPGVATAAGMGLAWLLAAARRRGGAIGGATLGVVAIGLLIGVPIAGAPWYWLRPDPVDVALRKWGPQGFEGAAAVAAYLRERTSPDARIFIYGSEPEIAFLAGRRDVSPYATVYPLTGAWPRRREFQERAWASIAAAQPTYILVSRNPASLMRGRPMDFFLEEKLRALLMSEYVRDGGQVYDPQAGSRVVDAASLSAGPTVQMEIWRRVGGQRPASSVDSN
jgi:hypothetical protein